MTASPPECWTTETSVFLTSFYGWTPGTWGKIGWSGDAGATRRANMMRQLTDPFIAVCYVTSNKSWIDRGLKGMIAGFYLVSHDEGDRDEFTHPIHHAERPGQWRHSLRAIRAFSYLPEYRINIREFDSSVLARARSVSRYGEVVTDLVRIERLRTIPWREVPVYDPRTGSDEADNWERPAGMVRPGPPNVKGSGPTAGTAHLPRELYILRLDGSTGTYLGRPETSERIYKVGMSVSPDARRQTLQGHMPRGAFRWVVDRTTRGDGDAPYPNYAAAVAGETAMKRYLADAAEWLDGEFYLAEPSIVQEAWNAGREAAAGFAP